jgi:iron complex transport system substrate-binding protein
LSFFSLAIAVCTACVAGTACERATPVAASAAAATATASDSGSSPGAARRIVSLFPSATDLLVALGARLVGRTSYDTDAALRTLPLVGDAATPSLEAIVRLAPDVVIAWDAVNDDYVRGPLAANGIPTVSLQALDTADIYRSIATLGRIAGRDSAAVALAARLRAELDAIRRSVAHRPRRSVFYVAWDDPPMTAGPGTFTGQLVELAGGRMIFPELWAEWPTVSLEEVVRRQPEVLVVPTGDMPAISDDELARRPGWRDLRAVRHRRIVRLPVELVNRPGPRIAEAARALRDALHPEAAEVAR